MRPLEQGQSPWRTSGAEWDWGEDRAQGLSFSSTVTPLYNLGHISL